MTEPHAEIHTKDAEPLSRKHTLGLMLITFITVWLSFILLFTSLSLLKNAMQNLLVLAAILYGLFSAYIGARTVMALWKRQPSAAGLFKMFGAATGIFFVSLPIMVVAPSTTLLYTALGVGLVVFACFIIFGARFISRVINGAPRIDA